MLIHELTPEQCTEVLARASLGRLGCARAGQPYIVPILFSFDPDRTCLYAFSLIGQKITWMRENPKVCLEVEEITDKNHWTTVVVTGRYEEIHQAPAEAEARLRAQQQLRQREEWWLPGAGKVTSREHPHMVIYRITIDRLTGRRAERDRDSSGA